MTRAEYIVLAVLILLVAVVPALLCWLVSAAAMWIYYVCLAVLVVSADIAARANR